jgi:hypothetical protein
MTSYQQLEISHRLGNHIATVYDIMVHYGRPEQPKPSPLQLCTKCGSHRTQVIGRLEDGKTLIIRCNACGAHSTVLATRASAAATPTAAAGGAARQT